MCVIDIEANAIKTYAIDPRRVRLVDIIIIIRRTL